MNKIPLLLFIVMIAFFAAMLLKGKDPAIVESAMLGRPAPTLNLQPALKEGKGFSNTTFEKISLVNFFASWCVECQAEQDLLAKIGKTENIPVYGIDFKDSQNALAPWLKKYGNPYTAIDADHDGRTAIDWGVYGVPETFVVDATGMIRYKLVGVVTEDIYQKTLKPLFAELKK